MIIKKLLRYGLYSTIGLTGVYSIESYRTNDYNSFAFIRFGRAAYAATWIAVDYKLNLLSLNANDDPQLYDTTLSKIHLRSAKRLKQVFCSNGGAFIKVGQHIGGLDYLLPDEYVRTMKELHNKAPESNLNELFETIETDLKCKITDVFKQIDEKPIGTASLAQCHKAILNDGTVVAVKIQHPRVKKNSHTDIKTMTFLVNCLAFIFPEFKFVWLAEETKKNLPIELDFINEGKNIEKVGEMLAKHKFVRVPKVYWNYCSDRILTMEYCAGSRVDDIEYIKKNEINVKKISERVGIIFSEMIFSNGFVHCDPHPGNLLIRSTVNNEFEMILLDHGLYQSLTESFRYNYAAIWMCILDKDIKRLEQLTRHFNVGSYFGLFACIVTGRSWDAINKGIDKVKFSSDESSQIRNEASLYLKEISEVLNRIPREMLLLLKTNDLIRGLETNLCTRNRDSAFIHMTKCCVRLINSYERKINHKNYNDSIGNKINILRFDLISILKEKFYLFKIFVYEFYLYLI